MPPAAVATSFPGNRSHGKVDTIVSYRNIRKNVDCIEAQRVMYVFQQLQRRLLLLGGFNALTTEQFKQFPPSCHKLRELVISEDVDTNVLSDVTREALRDVSADPKLCQLLRRKLEPRVAKQVDLINELRMGMFGK